ncbi:hypothetical protein ACFWQG_12965 [Rhodococcus sp. NPDC058532]|uniref:hypothetical protein n=1 Tax=Rhodococcus sp. NPDC058532 TaxID=3346540 RepID=UPI003664681A
MVYIYVPAVDGFTTQGAYLAADLPVGPYAEVFATPLAPLPDYSGTQASGTTLTVAGGGPATIAATFQQISSWMSVRLYINGTRVATGANEQATVSWTGILADGDLVQMALYRDVGGSLTVQAGTTNVTITITPA